MLKPSLMIATIIMLLLMFAVALIAIILAAKKPNSLNKAMRCLTMAFFAYLFIAFLHFYFRITGMDFRSICGLSVLSDAGFFVLILAWLRVITVFDNRDKPFMRKTRIAVTAAYAAIVEGIICIFGEYNGEYGSIIIEQPGLKYLIVALNGLFALAVILYTAVFTYRALRLMEKGSTRNGVLFFSVSLMLYMMWVALFDFEVVYKPAFAFASEMILDPVLVAYCVVDVVVIVFFLRKDPFELFVEHTELQTDEKLAKAAEEYGFTNREREVTELVLSGMNNPDIAERLCISEYTVKRHLNNIFRKAGVKNRYELIVCVQSLTI
ncbi:MAG: LuxR C-terminal-related transcriptional regulator [Lentihominibacter sp.]